jgi:hypothetical protein
MLKREGQVNWYAAGELTPGSQLTLQGTDCSGADAGARVDIIGPQAFPTELGQLSLEEVARDLPLGPCDDSRSATVSYRVSVDLDPQVVPWLPVSRFFVSNKEPRRLLQQTRFGEITYRGEGSSVAVTTVTVQCSAEHTTLITFLEIAGRDQISTETTFITPCKPAGCSASGGGPFIFALMLWRRRGRREQGLASSGGSAGLQNRDPRGQSGTWARAC